MEHTKRSLSFVLALALASSFNEGKTPPPIKCQDINANHVDFHVRNIETVYARAKANGAITVSDVGGYILLWQPAR
jgi:hypothetical protein